MSNEPQTQQLAEIPLQQSDLSLDVAFDILADSQRRAVLTYLLQFERRADLEELADHVIDTDATDTDGHRGATLHHLHLPKLADAGLITYDGEQQTAVATDSIQHLRPYLEWAEQVH